MPHGGEESREILRFLAEKISRNCYVNIMDQYRPCGSIASFSELQETIKGEDYQRALQQAEMFGLSRLDLKDFGLLMKRLFQV